MTVLQDILLTIITLAIIAASIWGHREEKP